MNRLCRQDWFVAPIFHRDAAAFVERFHYAGGGSNTGVYFHGLFHRIVPGLYGVAWWLPPTRVAAESVDRENWKRVLSLTRLAIGPGVPKNACTFLLAASRRFIRAEGEWIRLVTYADESQGHSGRIYRGDNWTYEGRTGPYPRWIDKNGRQVARLATRTRTAADMRVRGYILEGSFYKHKFIRQP